MLGEEKYYWKFEIIFLPTSDICCEKLYRPKISHRRIIKGDWLLYIMGKGLKLYKD